MSDAEFHKRMSFWGPMIIIGMTVVGALLVVVCLAVTR
jgi:hypothetical protein